MKLFKIFADYRPKNEAHKHWYYVAAENKLEAKKKFMSMISWLNVYEIEECDEQTVQNVLADWDAYIVF